MSLPGKFMNFSSQNGVIWCILGVLKAKNRTLVKILGVVNTGRPLHVKYWGKVATPATPAALTPMLESVESVLSARLSASDSCKCKFNEPCRSVSVA